MILAARGAAPRVGAAKRRRLAGAAAREQAAATDDAAVSAAGRRCIVCVPSVTSSLAPATAASG